MSLPKHQGPSNKDPTKQSPHQTQLLVFSSPGGLFLDRRGFDSMTPMRGRFSREATRRSCNRSFLQHSFGFVWLLDSLIFCLESPAGHRFKVDFGGLQGFKPSHMRRHPNCAREIGSPIDVKAQTQTQKVVHKDIICRIVNMVQKRGALAFLEPDVINGSGFRL